MTGCGHMIPGQLSTWPVPSTYLDWKPESFFFLFMHPVSWTIRPGGAHPSPGWLRTHRRWFHRRNPPSWPLISVQKAMKCRHRTGYLCNCGPPVGRSPHKMVLLPSVRFWISLSPRLLKSLLGNRFNRRWSDRVADTIGGQMVPVALDEWSDIKRNTRFFKFCFNT